MARSRKQTEPPPTVNGPVAGEVLTLTEAASYLRLSEQDVVRMVHEQGLPARRVGQEWRLARAAILHWLSTGSPKPLSGKEALLALAGKYKDDPDLDWIVEEAMRRRGRPAEGE